MSKRPLEPEESIEPGLNGLDMLLNMSPLANGEHIPEPINEADDMADQETDSSGEGLFIPDVLVFGKTTESEALLKLAGSCGFHVAQARIDDKEVDNQALSADNVIVLNNLNNIVEDCDVERTTFVCIFLEDKSECELILSQCLASDAYYIGLAGSVEKIAAIFEELRKDGAPDAELAAIAAPMGLNVRASGPEQYAVAIMAEMLAARAGKLKRLRQGSRGVRKS